MIRAFYSCRNLQQQKNDIAAEILSEYIISTCIDVSNVY